MRQIRFFLCSRPFLLSAYTFLHIIMNDQSTSHTKKEKKQSSYLFKRCMRGENGVPVENPSPLRHLDTLRLRRHSYSLNLLLFLF